MMYRSRDGWLRVERGWKSEGGGAGTNAVEDCQEVWSWGGGGEVCA